MKEKLKKKVAGIPVWVILLLVFVGAYIVWRRRTAGEVKENPPADALNDRSQPFGFSAPDMFPLQGPQGGAGPPGPAGPQGSTGMNPTAPRPPLASASLSLRRAYRAFLKTANPKWSTAQLNSARAAFDRSTIAMQKRLYREALKRANPKWHT